MKRNHTSSCLGSWMLPVVFFILALIFAFATDMSIFASELQADAQEHPDPMPSKELPVRVEQFVASLRNHYEIHKTIQQPGKAPKTGIERIISLSFKSRKPVLTATGKVYKRFRLHVYDYETEDMAAKALTIFAAEVYDSMFYKYPLLALSRETQLFRLDGGCLYNPQEWESLEAGLRESLVGKESVENLRQLKVLCGGHVELFPEKYEF